MADSEKYRTQVYNCIRCSICRSKYNYFDKVFRDGKEVEWRQGFIVKSG